MASSDSDMRRIPESVGVENSLIANFETQDITTEVVPLSDAQLIQLGLTTLGERQLIGSLCFLLCVNLEENFQLSLNWPAIGLAPLQVLIGCQSNLRN